MNDPLLGNAKNALLFENAGSTPVEFFESAANHFRSIGAEHILVTGLPLPGKDLSKLVLFQQWGETELSPSQLVHIYGNDPLLRRVAVLNKPNKWRFGDSENSWLHKSALVNILLRSAVPPRSYQSFIGIHIHHFNHLQVAICIAGETLDVKARSLEEITSSLQYELKEMHAISPLVTNRPGELSRREKLVLALTAEGKTAGSIADELQISQRTVHAHLQNAAEKMQASNKTQTVVEAMRYGQIQLY
jgi:DNA-binding CsgD family transcriptional regulator